MSIVQIRRNPILFAKKIKGKWVLLEKGKDYVYELNELGSFIWERAEEPIKIKELTEEIVQEYQVEQKQAQEDLLEFLKDCLKKKIFLKA